MTERTREDYDRDLAAIDAAHANNELSRDSFLPVAHTALFAASIGFIGDAFPLGKAVWIPALVITWFCSMVGLLALTFSFAASRRLTDARRRAINSSVVPAGLGTAFLNGIALWSFPPSVVTLFLFAIVNVMQANERPQKPTSATVLPGHRTPRVDAAATSAGLPAGSVVTHAHASAGPALRATGQPLTRTKREAK